jgi:hypothetical protein
LPQQHAGPVAGLGAASAGLNIDEAIAGIGRVVEHAAEFKSADVLLDFSLIAFDGDQRVLVVLAFGQIEQFTTIDQPLRDLVEAQNDGFKRFPLAAQCLRFFSVIPDLGVFQQADDFF